MSSVVQLAAWMELSSRRSSLARLSACFCTSFTLTELSTLISVRVARRASWLAL